MEENYIGLYDIQSYCTPQACYRPLLVNDSKTKEELVTT